MSPATAGNAETFSSSPAPSVLLSAISNVFVPLVPVSRTPRDLYLRLTPVDGNRSLPVPTNTYSCVPIATAAIDEKIGWSAPAPYNVVGDPVNLGMLLPSSVMSYRQMLPSRSPMYDFVTNRWSS